VQDHEKHARVAGEVLVACDRSEVVIVVLPTVLAECSYWSLSMSIRVDPLSRRLADSSPAPAWKSAAWEIHLDALHRYQKTRVHFADCLIAATSTAQDMPVARFDEDFRKFADVRVETNSSPKTAALTKQFYR
jgi:predicted nucleic acid-binding protein